MCLQSWLINKAGMAGYPIVEGLCSSVGMKCTIGYLVGPFFAPLLEAEA